MASTTAAGTGLAISAGTPAGQTEAAYKALTYTEVGNVESLGGFGAATEVVSFQPLKGAQQKYKGPTNYGTLNPTIALDDADAGQQLLATASAPDNNALYAVRVTKPDGSTRYFQVRVFGMPETIGAANTMITAQPVLEINTPVIKGAAV
ncbi:phage tail protein [Sphingomonas yunnanensis]|uniref:phage tail protein n=1 Tax=Sphingomonas yunnanensis TaxID=310400 RepID=UPI001CA672F6|nr:phage tail protein [Sphingomonas yunnanensis]MBY9062300.1 phage tail protein [Sphingomonas yunnanensis]